MQTKTFIINCEFSTGRNKTLSLITLTWDKDKTDADFYVITPNEDVSYFDDILTAKN